MSISNIIYGGLATAVVCIGTYIYAHNTGYDVGLADETAVFEKYKADENAAIMNYQTKINDLSNQLNLANTAEQEKVKQQDLTNEKELKNEISKPSYNCVIPADGVRLYNQRLQASSPATAH